MEVNNKILQSLYAGALADSTYWFTKNGILKNVTELKKQQQFMQGKYVVASLGISEKEEVFTKLRDIIGCANWEIVREDDGVYAIAKHCSLSAMCKKMKSDSPCNLYCLNPMEGMISSMDKEYEFRKISTLWNDSECKIKIG